MFACCYYDTSMFCIRVKKKQNFYPNCEKDWWEERLRVRLGKKCSEEKCKFNVQKRLMCIYSTTTRKKKEKCNFCVVFFQWKKILCYITTTFPVQEPPFSIKCMKRTFQSRKINLSSTQFLFHYSSTRPTHNYGL